MCVCIYNHHLILSKIVCIQSPPYTTITLNSGNSCDFNEMISNIYKITFYIVNSIIEYFNALLSIKVFLIILYSMNHLFCFVVNRLFTIIFNYNS